MKPFPFLCIFVVVLVSIALVMEAASPSTKIDKAPKPVVLIGETVTTNQLGSFATRDARGTEYLNSVVSIVRAPKFGIVEDNGTVIELPQVQEIARWTNTLPSRLNLALPGKAVTPPASAEPGASRLAAEKRTNAVTHRGGKIAGPSQRALHAASPKTASRAASTNTPAKK